MTEIVSLTAAAITHIQQMLLREKDSLGFRLSLKKTGCSGFAYVPEIVKAVPNNHIHFVQQGLNIYIDPTYQEFLEGVVIDHVAEEVRGLKQKRLVFINPNEKNRCGCGESFTLE